VPDANSHAAPVDAWLKRAARDVPPQELLRNFEQVFGALWSLTLVTLGEVTLIAITERVLLTSSARFPFLSALEIEPTSGIRCHALQGRVGAVRDPRLRAGLRFVLVEFLTVLGSLTAELLTPELHAELASIAPHGKTTQESGS